MASEIRLDLSLIFAEADADRHCRRCQERLRDLVGRLKGVHAAELVGSAEEGGAGQALAVRFDPVLTTAGAIEEQARRIGVGFSRHFAHESLQIDGLECADCAVTIERLLQRKEGVLWAGVNFASGRLDVEFDPQRIDARALAGELRQLGYGPAASPTHRHTTVFYIPEMDCDEEIALIRKKLESLGEVQDLEFNLVAQRLTVTHRSSPERLARALREIRMTPRTEQVEGEREPGFWGTHKRLILTVTAGLLSAVGLLLSTLGAAPPAVIAAYAAAMASGGWLVARRGILALRTLTVDMNVLMCLAVIGAAAIGQWLEGATVIFLFSLANLLESRSMNRARRSIRALMELAPATARVLRGGQETSVPVGEVQVGETLALRPGERIPLDGLVSSGGSAVNQAPITGESIPVQKTLGDEVFGGTINGEGYLEVRVTRPPRDTALARIIHSVEEAQSARAPSQSFVDRFARHYTPAVVGVAALMAVVPPLLFGAGWGTWLYRALVLLVVACPCALVISTPVTIVSGLARATRSGILFKGGLHLEAFGRLRAVAFDKTGTVTVGRPQVSRIVGLHPGPAGRESEVLRLAAGIEARSEHPLAAAVVACARERGVQPPGADEFLALPGKGAAATIEGKRYYLGNHRLFEEMGWCQPALDERLDRLEKQGHTAVILGDGREVLGLIALADQPRPEARQAVAALKEGGMRRTVLLTGDNRSTARRIAEAIGVDEYRAELLPEEKVGAVQELVRRYGPTGMVGDGVNDAPALAAATVGVAMGAAGSDAALETADVALMSDDLGRLPEAVVLSRRVLRLIKQNIGFALLLKAVFLALTPFGLTTLWMAVLADMGASLLVIFNGLRALRAPRR
jgi:Cd2+/Zn2+-exporting ATPase